MACLNVAPGQQRQSIPLASGYGGYGASHATERSAQTKVCGIHAASTRAHDASEHVLHHPPRSVPPSTRSPNALPAPAPATDADFKVGPITHAGRMIRVRPETRSRRKTPSARGCSGLAPLRKRWRRDNSPADSGSSGGGEGPCATSDGLVAGLALPDTNSLALDRVLAAKSASVTAVLRDFDLLDLTTQRATVTGTVLAGNADLDCALGLRKKRMGAEHKYPRSACSFM